MKMIQGFKSRPKIKKIGDAILIFTTSLSGAVMGLPISDSAKLWINFGLTFVGTIGKIMTNVIYSNNEGNN